MSGKGARAEGKAGKKRLRELTTAKPGTTTDDGAAASATNGRGSQIEPGKRVANSPDVAGPTSIPATLVVEKNAATHDTVAPDEARFRLRSKEDGEDAGEGRTFTRTKALEELKSWFHYEWDDDAMGKPIDDATLEDFDGFELETVATTEMSNPDNT